MARVAVQVGLTGALLLAGLAGGVLWLGALVVLLVPLAGLAGALALVGLALLSGAGALALVLRAQVRAAQARRRALASTTALAELALLLVPRAQRHRLGAGLVAGLVAGLGVFALAALFLGPDRDTRP